MMRQSIGQNIKLARIAEIEQQKKDPAWLNKALPFDSTKTFTPESILTLAPLSFEVVHAQKQTALAQRQKDFYTLLANLFDVGNTHRLAFSRNERTYTIKNNGCSKYIIKIVTELEKMGMIRTKPGYYDKENPSKSRSSKLWPTEKLLEIFKVTHPAVIRRPKEIQVKDEKKNFVGYEHTNRSFRLQQTLKKLNQINLKAKIELQTTNNLYAEIDAWLTAIFRDKLSLGGRIYSTGSLHFQQFAGTERAMIKINDQAVTELDFSGLHPRMLYAQEGIQYDADPYRAVDTNPELRPLLKQVLLCLINSSNKTQAARAALEWLRPKETYTKDFSLLSPKQKAQVLLTTRLRRGGVKRIMPFIDKFYEVHQPISKYFCQKNVGLKLQNRDGKIIERVLRHFTNQNVPILPVHDSLVIQAEHGKELQKVMLKAYQSEMSTPEIKFNCPVI